MCASFIITLTSPNHPKRYECLLRWSWRSFHPILRLRVHWALRRCGSFQGTRYFQTSQGGFRNGMWLNFGMECDWMILKKSLNVYGMYIECILNVYWMYIKCISNVYRIYIECILNYICWIYLGQKRGYSPQNHISDRLQKSRCVLFSLSDRKSVV